ncbi:TRAP transporter small permease [Succinatimonas hippei]|nr:TRAP transporter small permease [Succinatimonas hippei]
MKILDFLNNKLEMWICVILMSAIGIVLSFQVIMRYIFHSSLGWSEELARYMFVWLVFIGISYGAKVMRHIKIDAFLFLFPKILRPYIVILGDVLSLVFAIAVIYLGWGMVQTQLMIGQLSPAMRIPMWIVYLAPIVGFGLASIRLIQGIIYHIKHLKDGEGDPNAEIEQ